MDFQHLAGPRNVRVEYSMLVSVCDLLELGEVTA